MISASLSNRLLTLPFFCACCCKLAIAVTHICDIAVNQKRHQKINHFEFGEFFSFLSIQKLCGSTYLLGIFESFRGRWVSNFCKRKCNWWQTVSICPFESQCMIHGTSDSMWRTAIPEYLNFALCRWKIWQYKSNKQTNVRETWHTYTHSIAHTNTNQTIIKATNTRVHNEMPHALVL